MEQQQQQQQQDNTARDVGEVNMELELEQGWHVVKKCLANLVNMLESPVEAHAAVEEAAPQLMMMHEIDPEEYMSLYTTVYNLCNQRSYYSELLHHRIRQFLTDYLTTVVLPAILICGQHGDPELILKELAKRWDNHKFLVEYYLSSIFGCLDKSCIRNICLPRMSEAALLCFQDLVLHHETTHNAVIALINRERNGGQMDRALLKRVISTFVEAEAELGSVLDPPHLVACLLDGTAEYYRRKACAWIEEDIASSEYMLKAEECLRRERDQVGHFLEASMKRERDWTGQYMYKRMNHRSIDDKLLDAVQQELFTPHIVQQLLEKEHSGCRALLRDGKVEDLARMYQMLCNMTDGLDRMVRIFQEHVEDAGSTLLTQAATEFDAAASSGVVDSNIHTHTGSTLEQAQLAFVRNMIDLHNLYWKQFVEKCFAQNGPFRKALKEAFEVICNKRVDGSSSSTAELLATYCDHVLKRRSGSITEKETEETLEMVVQFLMNCVSDKDVFLEFHRRKLARRLLLSSDSQRANDYECERSLVAKLKQQCGARFTSSMESMLKDVTLSREMEASFREYQQRYSKVTASDGAELGDDAVLQSYPVGAADEAASKSGGRHSRKIVDLRVTVLTRIYWPSYKSLDHLTLPAEMVPSVQSFNEFYRSRREHRKLTWMYSMGTCIIVGKFKAKSIELIVSTLQAAVLVLFNSSDTLSYSEIKTALNVTDEETLRRLLHSLSCAKHQILHKHPPDLHSTVGPQDRFEFNSNFTHKMRKIKIPTPTPTQNEKLEVVIEYVDKGRRYAIDACLVRIMKSSKVLGYQQLVAECVEQLQALFKPDIKVIKKRIEDLIHRDYLERDPQDPNVFIYVA